MDIVIVDYGAGNIKSIQFAFKRLGFDAKFSNDPGVIKAADKVIFPGVGEASSAMRMLRSSGLDTVIPQLKQPVLGICLGMQLMCNYSEEGETQGLGIFDVDVKRFSNAVKVPQMGWNTIDLTREHPLFDGIKTGANGKDAYFVHSYHFVPENPDEVLATVQYGGTVTAVIAKDNMIGTQFHPEKSQELGLSLITNFLKWSV